MKTSKIKRLVPRKLVRQFSATNDRGAEGLREFVERQGADAIARMAARGYALVACLETGEGVFAREQNVVALHIQLPSPLYRKLDRVCRDRGVTKRRIVIDALEEHLAAE